MALADEARMVIKLDLAGNASSGIANLNKQIGSLSKGVGRAGRGVGQIGAGLTRAGLLVGGAAVAGITAVAKAAIDFEDAFAGVRKTVNETDLAKAGLTFEDIAKDFREMATEMPLAATEFARLGEIAGALGVKAQDISKFAEVTAKLGVTTNLTADAAADAFGRIGTILNLTGEDYTELADSVVALGNAGASTESEIVEITKRFAATAKQAGLTKEEMVGLASATASLGFEPERGGTALARVFANLATNVSTVNKKGKALSKGLGRSIKDLQKDIDQGKGLDIFMDVLREVRDLSPTAAARFLQGIGVTNVSDRTIFLAMSEQLPFVNEQLEIATKATDALNKEAEKKFATTASKIQIFKNNLIEAGIAMGEQFLPAVGRALDKLITAFKDPGTKSDIVQLGKDIGAAIDEIDWDEVLSTAKTLVTILKGSVTWAKRLFDAFNALPAPIKEATAGFLVLNKLSGGLVGAGVGNIFGGLGEVLAKSLAARIPIFGKAFVQPVFVTNMGAGGLGGGLPGAAGAAGGIGAGALAAGGLAGLFAVALQEASKEAAKSFNEEFRRVGIIADFKGAMVGPQGIIPAIQNLIEVVRVAQELNKPKPIPNVTRQDSRQHEGAGFRPNPAAPTPFFKPDRVDAIKAAADKTTTAVETMRGNIRTDLGNVESKVASAGIATALAAKNAGDNTKSAVDQTKTTVATMGIGEILATTSAGLVTASATRGVAPPIVGAIRSSRPIVTTNVYVTATHVTKQTTIQQRYGPGGGSGAQNARPGDSGV